MSYGIQIRDAAGREIIGPDTFTVRLITTIYMPAGSYRSLVRIPCAQARAGMFAVGTFLAGWDGSGPGWYTSYPKSWGYKNTAPLAQSPRMAAFNVIDGFIEVFPPSGSALFHGDQYIYLYSSI